MLDADGDKIRADGAEFGTTTGRKRRCGWYDALVVDAAASTNAFTDILDQARHSVRLAEDPGLRGLRRGRRAARPAADDPARRPRAVPIYELQDGWSEDDLRAPALA